MPDTTQTYRDALGRMQDRINAAVEPRELLLERAVGLLAGRVGCRLDEARVHIERMASERADDPASVAASVIDLFEAAVPRSGRLTSADEVEDALRPPAQRVRPVGEPTTGRARAAPEPRPCTADSWLASVQQVLDAMPGAVALLSPIRDATGTIVDYRFVAASPESVDSVGRQGVELVGLRLKRDYADIDERVWAAYGRALETGQPQEVGPITRHATDSRPSESDFYVRVSRLGNELMVSWVRRDEEARRANRILHTERLADLGWAEWDLTANTIEWSDQMYRIYGREPAQGPMTSEESDALTLPEDLPRRTAAEQAFARGDRVDVTYRIRVNDQVKHVRAVVDAVRDAAGSPQKIYGIVQDVTTRENTRMRLADVERQLAEKQRSLAAEHQLASQLQHIILPVPAEPIDLPGLRVALRYLPAEHLTHVGGDWYHAGALPDGTVLLAIGDVAGHGIRAATTMAQLRHAVGALAVTTTDPARLMGYLNELMCTINADSPEVTATAVIARYDPADGTLAWAQAGHPAPLFSGPGGTAPLDRPPGALLGVTPIMRYEAASVSFRPGNVLVLYTDGLVEHRDVSLSDGLATVIRTVDEAIAASPQQPLAGLLGRLRRANPEDDTCILAARPIMMSEPSDDQPLGATPAVSGPTVTEDHDGRH